MLPVELLNTPHACLRRATGHVCACLHVRAEQGGLRGLDVHHCCLCLPYQVRRLIIENSIESRIDQLQEKKRLLFESTVGRDRASMDRLTEEDLQFLFVM